VLPALVVLGVVVLMLAAATLGALWWVRAQLSERLAPATTEARVDPPATTPAERPVTTSSATIESPPVVPATPEPVTAIAPEPAVEAPQPARSSPAASVATSPANAQRPSASTRPAPSTVVPTTSPVTRDEPRGEVPAPEPDPAPVDDAPRAVATQREAVQTEIARDDALALVRAYVAARNTAHAAGLRRVWPSVSNAEVRRMTGEFAAPLTLTGCDVAAVNGARMRATCQFTQPGTTGFSAGTALNIRRQLAFDMERQGRGWVIVTVEG
jgi:hypothetical protein